MKHPSETELPNLVVSREDAKDRIKKQIEEGNELKELPISSEQHLEEAKAKYSKWTKYNKELLRRLFDNDSIVREYNQAIGVAVPFMPKFAWHVNSFRKRVQDSITKLEAIVEKLDLIPVISEEKSTERRIKPLVDRGNKIFIAHGRDEAAKQELARLIEKLDLKAIILHEQPNKGRTVIEKFEDYSNVGFAIVLLTPDDIAAPANRKEDMTPRARQNVILELGFFLGKLGRKNVCALYKENVEIPSDYQGVLFVAMDEQGGWKLPLAREMKAAGIPIDMDKLC